MRRLGIVGGLGPESSIDYYRIIIDLYRKKKRDEGSPELIIYSLNIRDVIDLVEYEQWDKLVDHLMRAIVALHRAGAEVAIIAANTPHLVFDQIKQRAPLPLLSIVEETFRVVEHHGLRRVGLLGTKTTMSTDFYARVFSRGGIRIVVPPESQQEFIHNKLMTELQFGRIVPDTRRRLLAIIKKMKEQEGIEGVILGCTELPLILKKDAYGLPFFNTTRIHAEAALAFCLGDE